MWFKKQNTITEEDIANASSKIKDGSAEAFKILYEAYAQKVYRYCLRMVGDQDLANDCFQEIFIKIYEKRETFKGVSFGAWLFRIAHNICINHIRSKRITEEIEDNHIYTDKDAVGDFGLKREIQKAIQKLPAALQEAIVLREYNDLSYNEIAEVLGIEVSLAKIRVFRARTQLKVLLKPLIKELNES
ncbi:MAG TPA: RNA polymerase sigma factor [Candidatus Kapabacteria bacterium]|nr:RNA polymerase sigma factor [Candidatus Kapabacteria bacterium]